MCIYFISKIIYSCDIRREWFKSDHTLWTVNLIREYGYFNYEEEPGIKFQSDFSKIQSIDIDIHHSFLTWLHHWCQQFVKGYKIILASLAWRIQNNLGERWLKSFKTYQMYRLVCFETLEPPLYFFIFSLHLGSVIFCPLNFTFPGENQICFLRLLSSTQMLNLWMTSDPQWFVQWSHIPSLYY